MLESVADKRDGFWPFCKGTLFGTKKNFNAHFILFYLIDPRKMQEKKFRNRFFNASLLKMNKFYFTYFFQKLLKINP